MALPLTFTGLAQTEQPATQNIDFEEDTITTNSLKDIIAMQELVYSKQYRSKTIAGVWKRHNFFAVSYANTSLSGKGLYVYDPASDDMTKRDTKYKSDWGVALKRSNTAAFHKKPIAEIVSFGLEYSLFDLAVNHYAEEKDMRFNSNLTFTDENAKSDNSYSSADKTRYYMPWGSEMYTFAYGVHLGPSIIVAPFTKLSNPGLAHIRLQTYFTVGYRASLMWMRADSNNDVNQPDSDKVSSNNFTKVDDSNKLSFGHGFVTTWGIRLNWKGIALGYEIVNGNYSFKSFETNIYGSQNYKFSESSQRISLIYTW